MDGKTYVKGPQTQHKLVKKETKQQYIEMLQEIMGGLSKTGGRYVALRKILEEAKKETSTTDTIWSLIEADRARTRGYKKKGPKADTSAKEANLDDDALIAESSSSRTLTKGGAPQKSSLPKVSRHSSVPAVAPVAQPRPSGTPSRPSTSTVRASVNSPRASAPPAARSPHDRVGTPTRSAVPAASSQNIPDSEGENTNQFLYDGINQLKDVYRGFDGLNGLTRGLARETIHITSRRKPNSDGS